MNIHNKNTLLVSLLFMPIMMYGNSMFPALIMQATIYAIFGWFIVALSLIIEFLLLYWFFDKHLLRVAAATFAMFAASAIGGLIGSSLVVDPLYFITVHVIQKFKTITFDPFSFNALYGLFFFFGVVAIKALIETGVGTLFFGTRKIKKLLLITAVANAIIALVGIVALVMTIK